MAHSSSQPIRVLTYNLHGCVGADGVRDVERVARVIRAIEADIVGLQEVDCRVPLADGRTQLDLLSERIGMPFVAGPTMKKDSGFYGNALLTRFAVSDVQHYDLSFRRHEPRAILAAKLAVADEQVRCFVTHFGLRAAERSHQVRLLLEHVGHDPVVLMGDFNEWRPRARTIADLDRALGKARAVRSFPARFPVLQLDRIWVRPRRALVDIRAQRSPLSRVASDHLPVLAELDLRAV